MLWVELLQSSPISGMGAYDADPRLCTDVSYGRGRRGPSMERAGGVGNLADRFSGLGLGGSSNNSMFQVMKAVEDAEDTIRQQKANADRTSNSYTGNARDEQILGPHKSDLSSLLMGVENVSNMENSSIVDASYKTIHQNGIPENEVATLQTGVARQLYSETNRVSESAEVSLSGQPNACNPGITTYSPPSSISVSPTRHQKEGQCNSRINSSGYVQMQTSELNSFNNPWKQDLILKVREREEEILQLKRYLADYSTKEAQICNEKYMLEKRIAHMRMAFDQQQQDLVDAASKALSYRQDIIEENIHLTYALQSAQQERSTYVSSLLPLLSEYGLQPSVPDALSIVSNLKVLFRHLHEKLVISEERLKESQYQTIPWHAETSNALNFAPQSPSNSIGAVPTTPNKNGLEIVPQPPYSYAHSPIASSSVAQTRVDWEALGYQTLQTNSAGFVPKSSNYYNMGRSSPSADRNFRAEDVPARAAVTQDDSHVVHLDESEATGSQHARDSSMQWNPSASPYLASGADDANDSYPYLPPVLEEPSSSFSEDEDPLPAISGLQISGEAYPGQELQASGHSINGTIICNFEWVRCLEDGSVNYIEYAKEPNYLVTADDVNSYLAIEVQPLDNRKRTGELVRVFANEQRKVTCDPEMRENIEKILSLGHMTFDVSISAGVLNIWERAVLAIKIEGYSIKCNGPRGVVVVEKFSQNTEIIIPYGEPTEFLVQSAGGAEYLLQTGANSSISRDTIVLVMRLFKKRAIERRKGRRKVLFFK